MIIRTKVDDIFEEGLVKEVPISSISSSFGMSEDTVDFVINTLEKKNVIVVNYPILPFLPPKFSSIALPPVQTKKFEKGELIDAYEINGHDGHYWAIISIYKLRDGTIFYNMTLPKVKTSTKLILDEIKEKVSSQVPPESFTLTEEEKSRRIYGKQCKLTEEMLRELVYNVKDRRLLCGMVRAEMFGLSRLEYLLFDPQLEEIVVNKARAPVIVYHRKYGWVKTNISFDSEGEVANYASKIGRRVGRQLATLTPILDAHLIGGERVNATLYPISVSGNTLTIRKFSAEPLTIPVLLGSNTLSYDMAAMLWQGIQFEMNLLVVGGTASGKTSMLNALLMLLPPTQRILTIEDTREIELPAYFDNWVPMVARPPNPEGLGAVTVLDLMINSLRMRPDRIIVGEVRRAEEAQVMFEAMHTGHSVYATFHADTAYVAVKRLSEEPIEIPVSELDVVDFVVTQRRDRKTNRRRTYEIARIVVSGEDFNIDKIYSYRARSDTFDFRKLPVEYVNKVNFYTGMTEEEVYRDIRTRANVLKWMVKQKITRLNDVGKVIKLFYVDKDALLKGVEKNLPLNKVIPW